MDRREDMERILNAESERRSSMSAEQLIIELRESRDYRIEEAGRTYQFEVELLENTDTYVHVSVAVDDGRLPYSIKPLSKSFIRQKRPLTKNDWCVPVIPRARYLFAC
jgi:hypothetical protein